ncbi:hypothetical protein KW5_0114745 [Xanthomonas vasicola pv. vasculorum NCPPB 1326]|nr:hypothetical protein KW5_0114745 [Xanthomonas vasicola pv. vasculorum NCPPB 1326]KFA35734.1 hypothetical protein KWG_0101750 [Xanthomonas vasicola pv. vasculorum NCPPB 1381]
MIAVIIDRIDARAVGARDARQRHPVLGDQGQRHETAGGVRVGGIERGTRFLDRIKVASGFLDLARQFIQRRLIQFIGPVAYSNLFPKVWT